MCGGLRFDLWQPRLVLDMLQLEAVSGAFAAPALSDRVMPACLPTHLPACLWRMYAWPFFRL
jgi:hypothetical protein